MKRGEIVLSALPGDYGKPRPALVVQADVLEAEEPSSVVVRPTTSLISEPGPIRIRVEPSTSNGLRVQSEVMVEKLGAAPRRRLRDVIGQLEAERLREVDQALLMVLGLGGEAA